MKVNLCADIIVTDLNMPGMNGIELLQYQSQRGCNIDKRNKALVSGYSDDDLKKLINQSGYAFFEKPVELSIISDWLNECEKSIDLSLPLVTF
jgi:CheY-like chemotaxis protein